MSSVTIRFSNFTDEPIFVQVDPFAGIYRLHKDEFIEIMAESPTDAPRFWIEETSNTRILTICDSNEYFVVVEGQRIHWSKYQTNLEGIP